MHSRKTWLRLFVGSRFVEQNRKIGVCDHSYIPGVLKQWREPHHEAFEDRNIWSLFNAFTETLKQGNLAELPKRTEALHGLLDVAVGLN